MFVFTACTHIENNFEQWYADITIVQLTLLIYIFIFHTSNKKRYTGIWSFIICKMSLADSINGWCFASPTLDATTTIYHWPIKQDLIVTIGTQKSVTNNKKHFDFTFRWCNRVKVQLILLLTSKLSSLISSQPAWWYSAFSHSFTLDSHERPGPHTVYIWYVCITKSNFWI